MIVGLRALFELLKERACVVAQQSRTFWIHAHRLTLHEAAKLASISLSFVDDTVVSLLARVAQPFSNCALEEPLAAFTTVHAIVLAARPVLANGARVLGGAQWVVGWINAIRSHRRIRRGREEWTI